MVLIPRTAPKISFGIKGNDLQAYGHDTPGPGHYNAQSMPTTVWARNAAAVFGTNPRTARERTGPGPGSYTLIERQQGPKYSCGPRRPDSPVGQFELKRERDAGPGPGAYDGNPNFAADAPKFSMASHLSGKGDISSPGPGHYTLDVAGPARSTRPVRRQRPGYSFGTSLREPGNLGKTPGPGQYSLRSTLSGPGYSLTPRRAINFQRQNGVPGGVPGPGAHDHHPDFSDELQWGP